MLASVVIVAKNNVIGCENGLVFDIKEDLKHFKNITSGGTVVMGRKTFEALPFVLPNRHHVIITTNKDYKVPESKEQIDVITDINEVIEKYANCEEEVYLIGGGMIYEKLMPHTKKHYITHVNKEAIGDTFFPVIDMDKYDIINQSEEMYSEKEDCTFYYCDYLMK